MDDRDRLLRRLRAAGFDEQQLAEAEREGRLPTLAVEHALGGGGRHTLTHVARTAGLDTAFVRELLQAIGRPSASRGERVYTDDDVEAARIVKRLIEGGLSRRDVLELTRVVSQGMAQSADAVRLLTGNAWLRRGDSEHAVGLRYARAADELGPLVPALLGYQFRTHLRDSINLQLVTEAEREVGQLAGTRDVGVAFADLVGYTKLGEQLAAEDLGRIATRLAELAIAAASRPARLVKTIGDAAMFVSSDVPTLVRTAIALADAVAAEEEELPALRVGVAYGPATTRGGDWFGATVNLASRVTDAAKPGTVLATGAVRDRALDRDWRRRRKRHLKGVDGRVRLYELARSSNAVSAEG